MNTNTRRLLWAAAAAITGIVVYWAMLETKPPVVRVGCITPLTGDGATYGAATKRGLDLSLAKINTAGGINDVPMEIVYEDDQMNAKTATNAFKKLATIDQVPVIIGAFGSSITLAIAPLAEEKRVVLFSASSTADAIRDAGDYIFRNVPPNRAQGKTAAEFVLQHLRHKRACVLYMNNDYGVSLSQSFAEHYPKGGGTIACTETYNPGATDFRAQLAKIKSHGPQIVFFPGHYEESGLILKQAKELGLAAIFVGGDGSYSPELIKIAGGAANGSYYTLMSMGGSGAEARTREFKRRFMSQYAEEPDVYAAYAYDALNIVAEAMRTGGTSPDEVKKALYGMRGFIGVTGLTSFDSNGEVDKPYGVYEAKSEGFVEVAWDLKE